MRTFRPKIFKNEERIERIVVRLSAREKRILLQKAQDSGLTTSAYVRYTLIFEKPDFLQQITNNYVKTLEIKGVERGLPI